MPSPWLACQCEPCCWDQQSLVRPEQARRDEGAQCDGGVSQEPEGQGTRPEADIARDWPPLR